MIGARGFIAVQKHDKPPGASAFDDTLPPVKLDAAAHHGGHAIGVPDVFEILRREQRPRTRFAGYLHIGAREAMGRAMAELVMEKNQKGLSTKVGSASATPPVPELRPARKLAAGKQDKLNLVLLDILIKLSDTKQLKPMPIPLSVTQAKVSLVSVKADSTLTFRSESGKTADFLPEKLKTVDFANLAVLASQFKPESHDASALAGVYLECQGRVDLADKKYAEAGPDVTAKMEAVFE